MHAIFIIFRKDLPARQLLVPKGQAGAASATSCWPISHLPPAHPALRRGLGSPAGAWQWVVMAMLSLLLLSCGGREQPAEDTTTVVIEKTPQASDDTSTAPPLYSTDTLTTASPPLQEPEPARQTTTPEERPRQPARRPAPAPEAKPAPTTPAPRETEGTPPPDASFFREGAYRLARVAGESLPLVLDMSPECDTKLLRGDLVLRNGEFRFQSYVVQECGGQAGPQEQQEARGTYRLEGSRIFLSGASDEVIGQAEGVVEGTLIRLQRISNDEEAQEVDWLFQLQ